MSSARIRFEGVALLFIAVVAVGRCSMHCRTNVCKKEAQYLSSCLKLSEDPCQDFYSFACGNFINFTPVPGGPQSWGPFEIVQNATNNAIKEILSSPKLSTDSGALRKAKTMYTACMNEEMREQRGLHPLLHMIKNLGLGGWPLISDNWNGSVTWNDVARIMAKYGFPLFFDVSVMPHPDNTSVDIIHLQAPSLNLPAPLHRTPRRQEENMDVLELSTNDDILEYLLDVTMEVRNHVGGTHVSRSSIKEELLGVLDFARKLQDATTDWFNFDPFDDTVPIGSLVDGDGEIDWLDFLQTVFRDSGVRLTSEHEVYTGGSSQIKHILQMFKDSDSRLLDHPQGAYIVRDVAACCHITDGYNNHLLTRNFSKGQCTLPEDDLRIETSNYIVGRLVMNLAPETTERMRGFLTRFYRTMELIPDDYPSWLYCINKVRDYPNTGLVAAVARDYEKNNFNAHYMRRVKQLVKDLQVSAQELLDENSWVDEETKRLMAEKMESMLVLAGFPEWATNVSSLDRFYDKFLCPSSGVYSLYTRKWYMSYWFEDSCRAGPMVLLDSCLQTSMTYTISECTLIIHKDDHFGNVARMRAFLQASNLAVLGNKNYPNLKWDYSPFIINAFYTLGQNSVTLPAGMMQHPFYTGQDNTPLPAGRKKGRGDVNVQKYGTGSSRRARKRNSAQSILLALDYGRFGSVVGHELTHAFDADGYLYDKSGQMGNGWSSLMSFSFEQNDRCFVEQYGRQGQMHDTLDEDIADNGGLRKAYRAFRKAWSRVGGMNATLPDLTSFTPDQLFFLGYATLWCQAGEDYWFDVHSPSRDRVINPLSNMEEFSDAWGCPPDSPMNPRDKCMLW